MEKSPCLKCDLLHENKNNPTCEACGPVKEYADRMAANGRAASLPIEMTDMANKTNIRRWTDDELNFLKKNYLVMTYRQLADELNRTEQAVTIRISKMGLRKVGNRGRREPPAAVESNPCEVDLNISPAISSDLSDRRQVKHRKVTYEHLDQIVDPRSKAFFILDLSGHPDLYENLIEAAGADFRTPVLQMLYYLNAALNGKPAK